MRFLLIASLLCAGAAVAEPLRVGTYTSPPFSMRGEDGRWEGIAVDLFDAVAKRTGLDYQWVETPPATMIDDLVAGRVDALAGPVAMTAERETRVDFTHPFYRGGLGVAEPAVRRPSFETVLIALRSRDFLGTVGVLTGLLFLVGLLVWIAERRRNPGEFEPDATRGLFSGFWWAIVTMTTVGYGDKAPVTVLGRLLGIVWMFNALILVALITAQLSAALTAERISSRVTSLADLAKVRVGNVMGAASLGPLRALGARPVGYADVAAGLRALSVREIDVFVHEEAVLLWSMGSVEGVTMSPLRFAPEDFAFALPEASDQREAMNRNLLAVLASEQWTITLRYYLGVGP